METIAPRKDPAGVILVIHSWWGLTDSFRDYGAFLGRSGFLVGLSDLFDGATATTEEEARALRARPRRIPMYKTLGWDIAALRSAAGAEHAEIGVVGFSMGGHWAVWLAQKPEYNVGACALYYAARGGEYARCKSGFVAHFAQSDPWVKASARKNMERALKRAGCDYHAFVYPGTRHWFAESQRSGDFDARAAGLARRRDLDHFERRLRN